MTQALPTSRDPVCGTNVVVAGSLFFTSYRDLTYHFCSAQCLERFQDIPALYTGSQRIVDVRPIPKRRRLRLRDVSESDIERACMRVAKMKGVSKVVAEKGGLLVEYDLRRTVLPQIESVATAEGLKFREGFHGFRRALWKLIEANELDNAAQAATAACCNRPPARLR